MAKVVTVETVKNHGAWISIIIRGLIVALAGGFVIFYTDNFIRLLTISIGAWMVLAGIYSLFTAFGVKNDTQRKNVSLIRSLLNIVIGALAVSMPFVVAETWWTVLLFIVAVQLCIAAVLEIMIGFRLRRAGLPAGSAFTGALITIAIALILFLAPDFLGETLVKGIGAVILLIGLGMMAFGFRLRSR
ncbi:MAG: HdeD family acid-resistance protein [Anaerolineae bacterium]